VFAKAVSSAPMARRFWCLYEWERIRQVPFQIDACLPPGSPMLLVMVRIINPHDHDIPMYWWSNMAVPETAATRVIVPPTRRIRMVTKKTVMVTVPSLPVRTSPGRSAASAIDYFFHR
jgi:hypothetical protein